MANRHGILAIGELLWDLLPSGAVLGGAPANVAVQAYQRGATVSLVSRVGNDDFGAKAIAFLSNFGLDTKLIQIDQTKPTGTVPVRLDKSGNPSFTITKDVAYDQIEPTNALLKHAGEAAVICFGTLAQRSPVTRQTLYQVLDSNHEAVRFLDINLRKECYSKETIESSLERCTMLKINRSEVKHLREMFSIPDKANVIAFCQSLHERFGISTVLITLGEGGSFAYEASGITFYEPGFRVCVQDTIGAGDAFTAGFIVSLLKGQDIAECCRAGNTLGSLSATKVGGMSRISESEIVEFCAHPPARQVDSEFISFSH